MGADLMTRHEPGQPLRDVERNHILSTVTICGGNRTHAAKKLKISLRSLRMKLNNYAAERDSKSPPRVQHEGSNYGVI